MTRTAPLPHVESDRLIADADAGVERLIEIMRRLREPAHGCPWDIEQDFRSIAPYTVEEAYEVADAIERGAMDELADELGDLLLQVVYHAQMAAEAGSFAWDDVVSAISAKMIRRHPHVFGDMAREDFSVGSWERLKDAERAAKGEARKSALDGVPAGMPGLTRAVKLQKRAARAGADEHDLHAAQAMIHEKSKELTKAEQPHDAAEAAYGDLLFAVAALGRHLNLDPEAALRRANMTFEKEFRAAEAERGA